MILATLGTSMVKVLVVTRCHAQYGAVHNHRDLCDTPLGTQFSNGQSGMYAVKHTFMNCSPSLGWSVDL